MMKKLGIGLLVVALAFFTFLWVKKGKIEDKLTALLHNKSVRVEQFSLGLFPSPRLSLQNVEYAINVHNQLTADRLSIQLNWWEVLQGEPEVSMIQIENGALWREAVLLLKNINSTIKPTQLSLTQLPTLIEQYKMGGSGVTLLPKMSVVFSALNGENDQFKLQIEQLTTAQNALNWRNLQVELELKNKRLFNTQQLKFYAKNGALNWLESRYQVRTDLALNQLQFSHVDGWIDWADTEGTLKLIGLNGEKADLFFSPNTFQLIGKQLSVQPFLETFNIPVLVTGKVETKVQLLAKNFLPYQGEILADITEGTVNGLNLLELIRQYAPINYDEDKLSQEKTMTRFEHLVTHFYWEPTRLQIKATELIHPRFVVRSVGDIDLVHGQCNVNSDISVNDARYNALRLPVHFFGDCKSPQYKVKFNRTFRDQLKEFIREKLK
ncbi:hypothetical protein [Actinobacillus porcinus]|uniref:hypothetical protein n=1 Tax=Actinobacillus porcinus TaxID=51048 RepID=UPI002A91860A|nr:hypothetical protein [Actinobacillus porcinus]MDY6214922.1 hypothetical protein [Actinobacillus porcinus]